jgi:hypothetical protein
MGALFLIILGALTVSPSSAQDPVEVDPAGDSVAEVFFGAISPDARFLTYTDWSTGDLAVRDLETGVTRGLTEKGTWDIVGFAQALQAISPDGRYVAYGWQAMSSCDLRIVDLEGSEPRILYLAGHVVV